LKKWYLLSALSKEFKSKRIGKHLKVDVVPSHIPLRKEDTNGNSPGKDYATGPSASQAGLNKSSKFSMDPSP
jgi:hypothetical protein